MTDSAIPEDAGDIEMINGTRAVLAMLAGKWNVEVLYLLATGTRRYSQVLYEVGEISKKTLTQTLRSLEQDGLVARVCAPDMPGRVEYSLTPLGWSITGPLMAMYEWAVQHLRVAHDQTPGGSDASHEHRFLLTVTAGIVTLVLGASPALAGSDGCSGDDCDDENAPAPLRPRRPAPGRDQPLPADHPAPRAGRAAEHRAAYARRRRSPSAPSRAALSPPAPAARLRHGPDGLLALLAGAPRADGRRRRVSWRPAVAPRREPPASGGGAARRRRPAGRRRAARRRAATMFAVSRRRRRRHASSAGDADRRGGERHARRAGAARRIAPPARSGSRSRAIGVDAPIIAARAQPRPHARGARRDFGDAGWWTGGARPGAARPGGHRRPRRLAAPARPCSSGSASWPPGAAIAVVRRDGTRARFCVIGSEQYPKARFPTERVYGRTRARRSG